MVGDILHLGLRLRCGPKDLGTSEGITVTDNRGGLLPSDQIYALDTDDANLHGTQQAPASGRQSDDEFGQGSSWQTRSTVLHAG